MLKVLWILEEGYLRRPAKELALGQIHEQQKQQEHDEQYEICWVGNGHLFTLAHTD